MSLSNTTSHPDLVGLDMRSLEEEKRKLFAGIDGTDLTYERLSEPQLERLSAILHHQYRLGTPATEARRARRGPTKKIDIFAGSGLEFETAPLTAAERPSLPAGLEFEGPSAPDDELDIAAEGGSPSITT